MVTGMEDFTHAPALVQFVAASALVIPGFFFLLFKQEWLFALLMLFGGSVYLIGSTYLVEWVSRKTLKKPYWALMLVLVSVGAVALYMTDYSVQMVGFFVASGVGMNLFMWIYAYPVVRAHYMMRSLKWLSFKKGLNKDEYQALCREKCGKFLYHPIAALIFSSLVSKYDYKGKTWNERFDEAMRSGNDDKMTSMDSSMATFYGSPEYGSLDSGGAIAFAFSDDDD